MTELTLDLVMEILKANPTNGMERSAAFLTHLRFGTSAEYLADWLIRAGIGGATAEVVESWREKA